MLRLCHVDVFIISDMFVLLICVFTFHCVC